MKSGRERQIERDEMRRQRDRNRRDTAKRRESPERECREKETEEGEMQRKGKRQCSRGTEDTGVPYRIKYRKQPQPSGPGSASPHLSLP